MKPFKISRRRSHAATAPRACVLVVVLVLALTSFVRAGDIVGQTHDASTGDFLANVAVTVDGSDASAIADAGGRFRIVGLAAGSYRLQASHLGYDSASVTVEVPATGDELATIELTSTVHRLPAYIVEGFLEGRAKALQQKRTAINLLDVISADSVGNLPDRNVAEAVARLAGLNLLLDQGEGRYVSIRGAEPNLNQVMMDGATMAAPGGTRLGRAVPLDTLSAGQVSFIEVIKSPTPDMDANAIGGTVNIRTTSAFDRKGRFVSGSVSGNHNGGTEQNHLAAQVTYSDLFGPKNRWGLAASASYEERSYQNEWTQFGWTSVTIAGTPVYLPHNFEIKPEWGSRSREGANLNLEFRPDARTQFYLRSGYSHTDNPETRFEVIYSPNVAATNVTLVSPRAGTFNTGNRSERRAFRYRFTQDLTNLAGGFKKTLGPFTLEPMATYSHAREERPYTTTREFRNASGATGPISFDLGSGFVPVRWDVDPAIDVPSKYTLSRTRDDTGTVDEKIYSTKTDVRWDTINLLGFPGYLKSGGKFLKRARLTNLESARLRPAGAAWNLGETGAQLPSRSVYNGRYQSLFLPNIQAIDAFISARPNQVTHDLVGESTNSIEDDYQIAEYIYAAYAMAGIKIGKLRAVGGVRWENTSATIRAVEERTVGNARPTITPTSGRKEYSKLFSNLQALYRFTDRLQLRAAFTQTLGRPAYEDARSLAIFIYTPIVNPPNPQFSNIGSVIVGNPALKPYAANNYDLSLEWHGGKSGGVFTLGAFRKDIANPIYTFIDTQLDVVYRGVGLQSLSYTGKFNGTTGRISGLEFSLHQPFRFLPKPWDRFGLDGNITAISSSEVIPTRPGEDIPFFRQPGKIRNLTLFFEQPGFSARLAYSYSGEQISSLGSNLLNDRYNRARAQFDGQVNFRINRHYSVTAAVRNLTREPDEMSFGIKNLVQSSRLLDRDYRLSLDFNY
jgi:TonB-dependent receptor